LGLQWDYYQPVHASHIVDVVVKDRELESLTETAAILDEDNRLAYCNPAWDYFALANEGANALRARYYGANVLDVCCDSLRTFYRDLYALCRVNQKPIALGYHCSSPKLLRVFQMSIEPFGQHILVVNYLLSESPHPGPKLHLRPDNLREGIATLCANCRRTRNWRLDYWEWIPEMLHAEFHDRISHGICENCSEFYFGQEFLDNVKRLQSS
jgi:hypothetical protein